MTPDANDLCVFAVKRGNISTRFDVRNMRYSAFSVTLKQEKVTLGSLTLEEPCYGTSATAVVRTDESQPKYIRITDFDDYGIAPNHQYMTAESYSGKHFLKDGDVLFARSGATVGKTYYYDGRIGSAVFAGYCIRFRFDDSKVLPKFAYWCTKTNAYLEWIKGIQRPSGQPNINKEEFKSYRDVMKKYKKPRVLILDEWLLYPLKETEARDLLEIIEARNQTASTIFCSQFDIPGWHEYLYDPTLADAICDRIIHNSHVVTIKGDSMRKLNAVTD